MNLIKGFFKKDYRMVIELDTKYASPIEAVDYIIQHLSDKGKTCVLKKRSVPVLKIDGEDYSIILAAGIPPGGTPISIQTAVLRKIRQIPVYRPFWWIKA